MHGLKTIVKKELSDHFSSYRFTIIFALIAMVSLITAYVAGLNIRTELQGIVKPRFIFLMLFTSTGTLFSLVQFVALFGPLVGLILGFDTINRERNEGTLSKLLSQPIYRDTVINGKFLAGVVIIAVTSYALSGDEQKALEAGCDDYDTKPVNFARLLEKINALTQSAA